MDDRAEEVIESEVGEVRAGVWKTGWLTVDAMVICESCREDMSWFIKAL